MSLLGRAISQALRPILSKMKCDLIESSTSLALNYFTDRKIKGRVFKNLYVPKENGQTTEIDIVFLTAKGFVIIECKGYNGKIIGSDKERNWSVIYPNGELYSLYNPVWQNYGHRQTLISAVRKDLPNPLNKRIPICSIVVFADTCDISGINQIYNDTKIIRYKDLLTALTEFFENRNEILSSEEIEVLSGIFNKYVNTDNSVKEKHIKDVKKNIKYDPAKQLNVKCPQCGKPLMLRTCKSGINEGQQFIGCSGFPKCKYKKSFRKY